MQTSKQVKSKVLDYLPAKTPRLVVASKSTQPAVSTEELTVVMTLEGHEPYVQPSPDRNNPYYSRNPVTISYVPGGEQLMSGSGDKTARKWDLRTGKEINEARIVCEQEVSAVAVSRDGRWIIAAGGNRMDYYNPANVELKAWEVKTGIMKTFTGLSSMVNCIDISADSKLLASGSFDSTVRIWNLDTGKLVAGPFRTAEYVGAVRFSQDTMKLAVNSLFGTCLEVWDIQGQKLDRRIGNLELGGQTYAPVFWTTNDKSIVAVCNLTSAVDEAKTICEFNASTLDTVGIPFEGHTRVVASLALSFDCALLASASYDHTIKLWAFESRQLLTSFDVRYPNALILSLDSRQLACTTSSLSQPKIYICNVPPNILASIRSAQDAQSISSPPNSPPLGDLLNSDATRRSAAVHPAPVISFTPLPHRPSPTVHQQQPAFLRTLRKFIPSLNVAFPKVGNDESYDPLDCPATSSFPLKRSLSAQAVTHMQSGVHSGENSPPAPVAQSSATTINARLSGWWPIHRGHALPPIVDVPLAQGKKRNAAAGAPKGNDGYVLDENFDSRSPSPNPNSQLPSAAAQTNIGEHRNNWSCFCL